MEELESTKLVIDAHGKLSLLGHVDVFVGLGLAGRPVGGLVAIGERLRGVRGCSGRVLLTLVATMTAARATTR